VSVAVNAALRKGILTAANSPRVQGLVRRHGMRLGAARFVAGETIDQAVGVLRGLNEKGLKANTTLLGEGVRDEAATIAVVEEYERLLDRIAAEGLRVNVALKLTHLGLEIDRALAQANLARLLERAAAHGNFIRIDMEQSGFVDATLAAEPTNRNAWLVSAQIHRDWMSLADYQNRRADYISAVLDKLINWEFAAANLG